MANKISNLNCQPLTEARWRDFEELFGPQGACGGCWCMLWRTTRSEFERNKGEPNKRHMRAIVAAGESPGLLAYADAPAPAKTTTPARTSDPARTPAPAGVDRAAQIPIGWCALAPRDQYPSLQRSRILKPVDDQPVWSVTCLFIRKEFRRQGVSVALLRAAQAHAFGQGAKILEGYPVEPNKETMPDVFAWTGLASAFQQAGFSECLRRSSTRPIMRARLTARTLRRKK